MYRPDTPLKFLRLLDSVDPIDNFEMSIPADIAVYWDRTTPQKSDCELPSVYEVGVWSRFDKYDAHNSKIFKPDDILLDAVYKVRTFGTVDIEIRMGIVGSVDYIYQDFLLVKTSVGIFYYFNYGNTRMWTIKRFNKEDFLDLLSRPSWKSWDRFWSISSQRTREHLVLDSVSMCHNY